MRLQNILDLTFPEFPKFFSDLFGVLPIKILKAYPSASKIASLDPDTAYDELTKGLRGHYNYQKFKNIILSAKNTIGKSNEIKEYELSTTINLIEALNVEIEGIENEIDSIMNQYPFKTLTIPGIGIKSAASIISEYSDFSLFKNPNQLLAFAGIEPSVSQSGTQSFNGHMVKRGSPCLRYTLMNVAIAVVKYNKVFSDYYYKKRNEGKCHRVALTHVVKKLLRIIYYLETNNVDFDPNQIK